MKNKLEKNKIWGSILSYSFLFIIFSLFIGYLFYNGNSSIIVNESWLNDRYDLLVCFRRSLIGFFDTGNLSFFTFNIGLGYNLILDFVLILGDVFSYLSVLVSESDLLVFYQVSLFIKLYLVGLSFIIYSNYKNVSNKASVVGSIIYTFSIFTMYYLINNIYIINLMILLPLLVIGIEKIVNDNKKLYFILISFIISINNIYFIPIIFIFILLYSVILIIYKYKDYGFKLISMAFFRVVFAYLVALLLCGFISVPVLYQLFNYDIELFTMNSFSYFKDLLVPYLVNDYSNLFIGINSIFLLYFPLSIKKFKENRLMLLLFILLVLILFVCNSFCFSNQLGFMVLFIFSFLIAKSIDLYVNIAKSDFKWIVSFLFINIILVLLLGVNSNEVLCSVAVCLCLLLVLLNRKELFNLFNKFDVYPVVFNFIFVVSILISIYNFYGNKNSVFEYRKYINSNDLSEYEEAIDLIKEDSDFYRITKDNNINFNSSLYYDFNSIDGTFNFKDHNYESLSKDLSNFSYKDNEFGNFNNRTKINSLLGNKYYVSNNRYYVSEGYDLYKEVNNTKIYLNNNYYGIASFYDKYITLEEYELLSSIGKENSLAKYVVVNDNDLDSNYLIKEDNYKEIINDSIKKIDYSLNDLDGGLELQINDNDYSGELYLKITNFKAIERCNIKVSHKDVVYDKNILSNSEIIVNLSGYSDIDGSIYIYFDKEYYSYDSIELYVNELDSFDEDISKLKSSNFVVSDFGYNYINGSVNASNNGLLQFALSYDDNYKVYVDGELVNTLNVNKYFLGIYLENGQHDIKIIYNQKGNILGLVLSGIGLVSFITMIVIDKKNKK